MPKLIDASDLAPFMKEVARFYNLGSFAFGTVPGRTHGIKTLTPHQPFDSAQRAGHLLLLEFGVDPWTAITSLVPGEYRFDLLEQGLISLFALARQPLLTFELVIITASGHPQHLTKHANRELVLVRFDKRALQVVCFAK